MWIQMPSSCFTLVGVLLSLAKLTRSYAEAMQKVCKEAEHPTRVQPLMGHEACGPQSRRAVGALRRPAVVETRQIS